MPLDLQEHVQLWLDVECLQLASASGYSSNLLHYRKYPDWNLLA